MKLFNVVFYDGSKELPNDKILYIITKKGTFLRKDLGTICSCTKVDSISFLKEIEPYAKLKIPQICGRILAAGLSFLRWVYVKYETESGLLIYYNSTSKEYILYAPSQEVSYGGVSWDNQKESIPKGFIRLGTIHSHADMSAFHSGIDIADEKSFDGLHITFGNLGEKIPSLVASVVANGSRFPVKKEHIRRYLDIDVIDQDDKEENVKTREITQPSYYEDYQAWLEDKSGKVVSPNWKSWKPKTQYTYKSYMGENEMRFRISNSESINFTFPEVWKSKVIKKEYTAGVYRIVNGKLIPSKGRKQIGFVDNGNCGVLTEEELLNNYYGYPSGDDEGLPFGGHVSDTPMLPYNTDNEYEHNNDNDLSKLPHIECVECMYRIIADEAMERGLIDVEKDNDGKPVGELPIEEDYDALYGKHTEDCGGSYDDVLFDDEGNIVDENGKIIEKLDGNK